MQDVITDQYQLLYGDCLLRMQGIPDASIDMILCDLPYGTTACKWDSIIPFEPLWEQYKRVVKPNAAIVLFGSQPFTTKIIASNMHMFKYCLVWEKNRATNFPNAKRRPLTAHEDIIVFMDGPLYYYPQKTTGHKPTNSTKGASQGTIYRGDSVRNYVGGDTTRFPRTVLKFDCQRGLHPTQKSTELLEYLIRTYSNEGETVLENTMGSCSTGVSCLNTNRKFIGVESNEGYFEISCKRMEDKTEGLIV